MAKTKRKYHTLRATRPNAGIESAYRKQLYEIVLWMLEDLPRADNEDFNFVIGRFTAYLRGANVTEKFQKKAYKVFCMIIYLSINSRFLLFIFCRRRRCSC